ncbi:MAG: hypothetical protein JW953_00040 [Anaerolineae bacterium]|nr:hypothetical protein [Anaerolineae bacterium]
MNTKNKWIIVGVIAAALVLGLTLGAMAVTLIQRVAWGYSPAYAARSAFDMPAVMPGPMMGPNYSGPMGRMPHYGRGPWSQGPMMGGSRGRGGFGSMMGGGLRWGGSANSLITITAEQLKMTPAELTAELQAGKTIADLAQEKDVSLDKLVEVLLAPHAERVASLVANEVMTQEQVDTMLAAMKANLTARLSESWSPGGARGWGGDCPGFGDTDGDGVCDFGGRGLHGRGRGPMGRWW